MIIHKCIRSLVLFLMLSSTAQALQNDMILIPMQTGGAHTYYIDGKVSGNIDARFMVDTGSGYTTINEETLGKLQAENQAEYVKDLIGILADGSEKRVPVYRISSLTLGNACKLQNIEAAVFPGNTRQILGLSTLRRTGSFVFSFEPATLILSQCDNV